MARRWTDPGNILSFDIETGGLYSNQSSLISIAHAKNQGRVRELYARPVPGTLLSSWSRQNVWGRIKSRTARTGQTIQSEREMLGNFLGTLQSVKPGTTLTGWNIGYNLLPQASTTRLAGFDIPFLLGRAEKHGMLPQYQSALSRLQIKDLGAEWSTRIAKIVAKPKYARVVDPKLHGQAVGLVKSLYGVGMGSAPLSEQAAYLSSQGIKFSGWKQETVSNLLGLGAYKAHMAHEDVAAFQKIMRTSGEIPEHLEEAFVRNWNTLALANKATTSARSKIPETFSRVLPEFTRSAKIGLGIGAIAAALFLIKPLKRISGRDDDYNVIEGLPHRGYAGATRKQRTDFGSGYQNIDERKRKDAETRFAVFAASLKKYGLEEGTGHKRISIPKSLLSREDLETLGFISTTIAVPEQGQSKLASYRNPGNTYHIHEYEKEWTMHKDRYTAANMKVTKYKMEEKNPSLIKEAGLFLSGLPHVVTEGIPGVYYYLRGKIFGSEPMVDRLDKDLSSDYKDLINYMETHEDKNWKSKFRSLFSGKDDHYNKIQGLQHRGEAGKSRRYDTDFGSGFQGSETSEDIIRYRFNKLSSSLSKYGLKEGTGHKRILIPKSLISQSDLTEILGFVPVKVAIPESGQITSMSYRHPLNKFHLHDFGDAWTMHQDRHAAATMTLKKMGMPEFKGKEGMLVDELLGGISHAVKEGAPGAYYYTRGLQNETDSMGRRLQEHLSPEYENFLKKMTGNPEFKLSSLELGAGKSILSKESISNFFSKNKKSIGLGLGILGALGVYNLFSGKDDDYNTIEGLRHDGIAGKARRKNTDFGSGYQGILNVLARESLEAGAVYYLPRSGLYSKFSAQDNTQVFRNRRQRRYNNQSDFSGYDDRYNVIEGLRHGGLAGVTRRMITDFGSGWLRRALSLNVSSAKIAEAVVRGGGKALSQGALAVEKFGMSGVMTKDIAMSEVQHGLANGWGNKELSSFISQSRGVTSESGERWFAQGRIGKGGFGEAYDLYNPRTGNNAVLKVATGTMEMTDRTMITGPAFTTEGIDAMGNRRLVAKPEAVKPNKEMWKSVQQFYKSSANKIPVTLDYEAAMQTKLRQQIGNVPEIYGRTAGPMGPTGQRGIIMEKVGHKARTEVEEGISARFIRNKWGDMINQAGPGSIIHFDPQMGNVTRRGGRMFVIDAGATFQMTENTTKQVLLDIRKAVNDHVSEIEKEIVTVRNVPLVPVKQQIKQLSEHSGKTAATKKLQQAAKQREATKVTALAGKNGGRISRGGTKKI